MKCDAWKMHCKTISLQPDNHRLVIIFQHVTACYCCCDYFCKFVIVGRSRPRCGLSALPLFLCDLHRDSGTDNLTRPSQPSCLSRLFFLFQNHLVQAGATVIIRLYGEKSFVVGSVFY